MPLISDELSNDTALIMQLLHNRSMTTLSAQQIVQVYTQQHNTLRFELQAFAGSRTLGTFYYIDGAIYTASHREATAMTTAELATIDYTSAPSAVLNIADPTFSIDDLVTYIQNGIDRAQKDLTCDPAASLFEHIKRQSQNRKCFRRSNCQGQRVDLRYEKNKIIAGIFGFPDIAAKIVFDGEIFTIESESSEPTQYQMIEDRYTTKYSITATFFEVLKVWFDNHKLKVAGKKQGYHRGRRR